MKEFWKEFMNDFQKESTNEAQKKFTKKSLLYGLLKESNEGNKEEFA